MSDNLSTLVREARMSSNIDDSPPSPEISYPNHKSTPVKNTTSPHKKEEEEEGLPFESWRRSDIVEGEKDLAQEIFVEEEYISR